MRVLVVTLGATALQKYSAETQSMQLLLSPSQLLASAAVEGIETELQELQNRSGAELTFETVLQVRDAMLAGLEVGGTRVGRKRLTRGGIMPIECI